MYVFFLNCVFAIASINKMCSSSEKKYLHSVSYLLPVIEYKISSISIIEGYCAKITPSLPMR